MTWRLVYASDVGTSHTRTGADCQDSCWAEVNHLTDGQPLLSIFVADGAGSATKGGQGAELAVEAAAAAVAEKVRQETFDLSDQTAAEIVFAVRERIGAAAKSEDLSMRDFATTFIGVLSSADGTLVMQVGDGGIVVDAGAGLDLAIVPMSGEYTNMTHFVTDVDAVGILATKTYAGRALKVAAFSDGMQRLALNLTTNTPHEPFFSPFFKVMANASEEQEEHLQSLLVKFLGSQPVSERTDDDKTLALALWVA